MLSEKHIIAFTLSLGSLAVLGLATQSHFFQAAVTGASECSDRLDNDGDGGIDYTTPRTIRIDALCNDGIDNDGDGDIDYGDKGCVETAKVENWSGDPLDGLNWIDYSGLRVSLMGPDGKQLVAGVPFRDGDRLTISWNLWAIFTEHPCELPSPVWVSNCTKTSQPNDPNWNTGDPITELSGAYTIPTNKPTSVYGFRCQSPGTYPHGTYGGSGCRATTDFVRFSPANVDFAPDAQCTSPSGQESACGNGAKEGNEECDDGNIRNGDGCSAACRKEQVPVSSTPSTAQQSTPFSAQQSTPSSAQQSAASSVQRSLSSLAAQAICGNGVREGSEQCDGVAGCCSPPNDCQPCRALAGYTCTNGTCTPLCGDGVRKPEEECDDKNRLNGDGCSGSCDKEEGWTCNEYAFQNEPLRSACSAVCGDGRKLGDEQCDDGNTSNDDGCSDNCRVMEGYACAGTSCKTVCGDGKRMGNEQCDDGNKTLADGCNGCMQETGWACGNTTCIPVCGDGRKLPAEACDDGNVKSGDGCGATCNIELGFTCDGTRCEAVCGDRFVVRDEECDDGNKNGSDGCSSDCRQEEGWSCTGITCRSVCGDGRRRGGEQCDDGNNATQDGCGAGCTIEGGWSCEGDPSACRKLTLGTQTAPAQMQAPQQAAPRPSTPTPLKPAAPATTPASAAPARSPSPAATSRDTVPVAFSAASAPLRLPATQPAPAMPARMDPAPVPSTPPPSRQLCGNAVVEGTEECDRGLSNSNTPNADCRSNCTFGRCGDRILDPRTEECDDGNAMAGDGCSARCIKEAGTPSAPLLTALPSSSGPATSVVLPLPPAPSLPVVLSLEQGKPVLPTPVSTQNAQARSQQGSPPLPTLPAPIPPVSPALPMPSSQDIPPGMTAEDFATDQDPPSMPAAPDEAPEPTQEEQEPPPLPTWPVVRHSSAPNPLELSRLHPEIFPDEEAVLRTLHYVKLNICGEDPVLLLRTMPFFLCLPEDDAGVAGSLLSGAAAGGSLSLAFIAISTAAGLAYARSKRRQS